MIPTEFWYFLGQNLSKCLDICFIFLLLISRSNNYIDLVTILWYSVFSDHICSYFIQSDVTSKYRHSEFWYFLGQNWSKCLHFGFILLLLISRSKGKKLKCYIWHKFFLMQCDINRKLQTSISQNQNFNIFVHSNPYSSVSFCPRDLIFFGFLALVEAQLFRRTDFLYLASFFLK